jgi:ABC-type lipoprotein release transport system permease subunit
MSARPRPLAAAAYLARNPRRVLPAVVVQALVTALVLAVVTPLTGFEATAEASLEALRHYTGVTPMRRRTFDEELSRLLDANPALDRRLRAKALPMRMPMIVGEAYAILLALDPADQEAFVARVGDRLVEGRLPEPGSAGVVVHRDVARARGFRIGSEFGRLVDPDDPSPGRFVVCGILEGPARLGIADLGYATLPDFVLSRIEGFEVVWAKPGRKAESDRYLEEAKDAEGRKAFKVWDEAYFRHQYERMLRNLPAILNAVVGAITVIISLVVVLLNLIAFQARADEFAILLAVGVSRRRLVRKLAVESGLVALAALVLGVGLGLAALATYEALVLEPRAIVIRLLDPYALVLAGLLPVVAAAASAVVLAARLRRMDPVAVIQRRNA